MCPDGGYRSRVPVPGNRGAGGKSRRDTNDQLAVFGVDPGCTQRTTLQSTAGQDHRSGPHHRHRKGIVSVPEEPRKTEAKRLKTTGAPLRRLRENSGSQEPGINNLEWATRNDQSGPRGVVKTTPVRIAKQQQTNKKKMATIAAVFTKAPFIRTPQQVVDSIFRSGPKGATKQSPSKPENKRVWASLTKGKSVVMDEVRQEVVRRDPDGVKTLVALTDGERALQIRVSQSMKVTLILDLIHVLERVWRAAHVFQPEGTAEAEVYAKLMALRILQGDVAQVIKGLRQTVTKRRLIGSKKKALLEVATYFQNNAAYMRYNEYLALGFPIASGPVEGACKNLIKDRMERSGMR